MKLLPNPITLEEAAKRLRISVPRVRQLIREMDIKTQKVGVIMSADDLPTMRGRDKKPGPKAKQ